MAVAPVRATRSRRSAAETRAHILGVAGDLFYREGIRATGVDMVAVRAGVAPTTLYRLFASKDDLVAAYVEQYSKTYRDRLTAASLPGAGSARHRILAVFDAFTDEALSEGCRGCPFLMVLAEFPDPSAPAHARAVAHKSWLRALLHDLVRDLASETAVNDAAAVADQLALVAEGIYASVQALGAAGPMRHGRLCAEAIIEAATTR